MSALLRIVFIVFLALIFNAVAISCPVCYGAADGKTIEATNTAILILLGITVFVLVSIGSFFIFVWRRSRKLREQISHESFVDDNGTIHWKQKKGMFEWKNS